MPPNLRAALPLLLLLGVPVPAPGEPGPTAAPLCATEEEWAAWLGAAQASSKAFATPAARLAEEKRLEAAAETGAALFAAWRPSPEAHPNLPDQSYAGYRRGEVPIPDVPVVVDVRDAGAVPGMEFDNTFAFERAMELAEIAGGGAVYVPEGTWRIDGLVHLSRSGVVLRGAGMGRTVLRFTRNLGEVLGQNLSGASSRWNWAGGLVWIGPKAPLFIQPADRLRRYGIVAPSGWTNGGPSHAWEYWHPGPQLASVVAEAARGDRVVTVDSAAGLAPGDFVLLTWDNSADSSLFKAIAEHPAMQGADFGSWMTDLPSNPRWQWPAEIVAVDGNAVTLAQPLRVATRAEWNVRLWSLPRRVEEVGVEDLTIQLQGSPLLGHNAGFGWNGVYATNARDSWVRRVEVVNGDNGFMNAGVKNLTYADVHVRGPSAIHHPFNARCMSHDVLFDGFSIASSGRVYHGISTEWLSSGNTWTRGTMKGTFDSHRALSFDVLRTAITVDNHSGSFPGGAGQAGLYAGRRTVHWNIDVAGSDRPEADRGLYILHPRQFALGALVGVRGAPVNLSNGVAMPAADLGTVVADTGLVPEPANLLDAQVAERRARERWARLVGPTSSLVAPGEVRLEAVVNPGGGRTAASVAFVEGDTVLAPATAGEGGRWAATLALGRGTRRVAVRVTDDLGATFTSVPRPLQVGYRQVLDDTHPDIQYTGGRNAWNQEQVSRPWGGGATVLTGTGKAIRLPFRGSRARVFLADNSDNVAKFDVRLDGVVVASVSSGSRFNELAFDSGLLADGDHLLELVDLGSESITLDRLEVDRTDAVHPVARIARGTTRGAPPFRRVLDGSGSHAADGTIASWAWDLDGNGTTDATGPVVEHVFATSGAHRVLLTVTDSAGRVSRDLLRIEVNAPPAVALTSPAPGASLSTPLDLELVASASDADGQVRRVEFWRDGALFATDTTAGDGWRAAWPTVRPGTYAVQVRAFDNAGDETRAETVTLVVTPGVSQPPTIVLTSPAEGGVHAFPAQLALNAVAADPDGRVVRVEFRANGTTIGTDTDPADGWGLSWSSAPTGTVVFTALAVDDYDVSTLSAPVRVTVRDLGGTGDALEQGGRVVVEAERFTSTSRRNDSVEWTTGSAGSGFVGSGYLSTPGPVAALAWDEAAEAAYRVVFSTPGAYRLWVRRLAPDLGSNSAYVGVDGTAASGTDNDNGLATNAWVWKLVTTVNVASPGTRLVQFRRRESAYRLDRFVMTTDTTFVPSGTGPEESPRQQLPPSYARWSAGFGTLDPAGLAAAGDPDRDGIPNLLEYLLDLPPDYADPAGIAWRPSVDGARFELAFRVRADAPDLTWAVETATDVRGPWTALPAEAVSTTPEGEGIRVVASVPADAAVLVRLRVSRVE